MSRLPILAAFIDFEPLVMKLLSWHHDADRRDPKQGYSQHNDAAQAPCRRPR